MTTIKWIGEGKHEVSPRILTPHPLNEKIYGANDLEELTKSIKRLGILEPIVYTLMQTIGRDKYKDPITGGTRYILSGTRRWSAAMKLGLDVVPARMVGFADLEAEQFLIEANRQRVKTKSQRLREFKHLKQIERKLAKERQREAGRTKLPAKLQEAGEASEKAAKAVGLGTRTAEKGVVIVNLADAGDPEARKALVLIDKNESSVNREYKRLRFMPEEPPRGPGEPPEMAYQRRSAWMSQKFEAICVEAAEAADDFLSRLRKIINYKDDVDDVNPGAYRDIVFRHLIREKCAAIVAEANNLSIETDSETTEAAKSFGVEGDSEPAPVAS